MADEPRRPPTDGPAERWSSGATDEPPADVSSLLGSHLTDVGAPVEMGPAPGEAAHAGSAPPGGRRLRPWHVALGVLLAAGLVGVATLGVFGWRVLQEKDARLTTPDSVAGLDRDTSAEATETAEYLRTALAADVDLDTTVGAVYSDPSAIDRDVFFFGGTGLIWSPGNELDGSFDLLADQTSGVTGAREFPAGELSGSLRCGNTTVQGEQMAVCAWADHGSLAVAMFLGRGIEDSADLMRQMRDGMQTR